MEKWEAPRETAPSQVRADEPRLPRMVGIAGLFLVAVGMAALAVNARGYTSRFLGPTLGTVFLIIGLAALLYHAARETDQQIRRVYGILGYVWLGIAGLATAAKIKDEYHFLPHGLIGLSLGLFFLMAFIRNETEIKRRDAAIYTLGGIGVALALTGFIGGNISEDYLLRYYLLVILLALVYWWAFIGALGTADDWGYKGVLAMGALGAVVFLVAVFRSLLPLFYKWHMWPSRPDPYLVPSGLLLMGLGLLYLGFSAGMLSDNRLVVMTRRELAAMFYSPIGYIVLIGITIVGWWMLLNFIPFILPPESGLISAEEVSEPIIRFYFISWWPILAVLFIVPVLTMRLLSEEQRTGTLEVLLTAPVGESAVVLSKFIASVLFFMTAWIPIGLYLVSVRVEGGQPFEYRPLLSFFLALACTGAGFLAMGQFFSSLTRSQVAAAILTFAGMFTLFLIFFAKGYLEKSQPSSKWIPVLTQASFVDLWITSTDGVLAPRYLIFHISAAIFWLFLTVKVLESRKWR